MKRPPDAEPTTAKQICDLNGWGIGTRLRGAPILRHGQQIENGVQIRITYFTMQGTMLAACERKGEAIVQRPYENFWDLTCRDWEAIPETEENR